jgi:hypothetical protein
MDASIAQFSKGERPRTGSVVAPLLYLGHAPERPVSYVGAPPPGVPPDDAQYLPRPVTLRDARTVAASLSVDFSGFELWQAPSTVRDFLDDEEVRRRYYPEVAELALRATEGDEAHVFDHLVRRREAGRPVMTLGARAGTPLAGPAGRVHVDYTEASGARRFGLVLDGWAPRGRFCIVNVWRSIGSTPVLDTPLALCDARSVLPEDLVPSELRYPSRTGEIYLVRYRAEHRWSYFSEMRRDEALVFKQYDSERTEVARFVPHAAFDLPAAPADVPPRQSIEARVLVTFQ